MKPLDSLKTASPGSQVRKRLPLGPLEAGRKTINTACLISNMVLEARVMEDWTMETTAAHVLIEMFGLHKLRRDSLYPGLALLLNITRSLASDIGSRLGVSI